MLPQIFESQIAEVTGNILRNMGYESNDCETSRNATG
jgi:hypothetical protein